MSTTRYVCVHGHFYQPPRENPWLEEIEREPSAAPAHDWNSRIADECYTPNTAARVLDDHGRVHHLTDNYAHMSFNFGPTLLRWMERHRPATYRGILEADKRSRAEHDGHGNAIAQVYNHVILPLANDRDKRTQVRWGLRDFEHRFGRRSEGIWLAETACDQATLDVLAEEGVRFTILSPYQASRFRVGEGDWVPCGDGSIPTGRAWRAKTRSGKHIKLYFYDGGIARGIAFEGLLSDAAHVVSAFHRAHEERGALDGEPWLVHTATDGESYGHHFKFGDMALAAALKRFSEDPNVRITNYGAFLAAHGARGDVELHPVSAWSCAHGVGRWERDCGCRMNPDPLWNQKWRTGLRAALDVLRDRLATHYERAMGVLAADPWAVRDAYIDVILEPRRTHAFVAAHSKRELTAQEQVRFFQLLELQRAALLMYTSCGWFFDDISGGESVILMKYAARAIDLARRTGCPDPEPGFIQELAQAESNVRSDSGRVQTGADIYRERVVGAAVDVERIAMSYALLAASRPASERSDRIYVWRIAEHEEHAIEDTTVPVWVGRLGIVDDRTGEQHAVIYTLVHFGGLDFRCHVRGGSDVEGLRRRLQGAADAGDTADLVRVLDEETEQNPGSRSFGLQDALADLREQIAGKVGEERLRLFDELGAELLFGQRALLKDLVKLQTPLPTHIRGVLAFLLARRARLIIDEILNAPESLARSVVRRLRAVLEDAREFDLTLDLASAIASLEEALARSLADLLERPSEARASTVRRLVEAHRTLGSQKSDPHLILQLVDKLVRRAVDDPFLRRLLEPIVPELDACCGSAFAQRLRSADTVGPG